MLRKPSVYIGAPIEYESERVVFQAVYDWLATQESEAIIIANVNMGTSQVDLIVVFERKTYVIEVKAAGSEIKGEVNGVWQQKRSTHTWAEIRNYYDQTIKAGHAVKDEISAFLGRTTSYPSRLLLFSQLHPASQIPASDFKVAIIRLADWHGFDSTESVDACTLSEWRRFLSAKKIQLLNSPAAAISKDVFNAEELLANYHHSVEQTYSGDLTNFVPVTAVWKNQSISSANLSAVLSGNDNMLIAGSSGCSKTLLAKMIVVDLSKNRAVAIYLEAKYFESLLKPLLEDEIKLLNTASALHLFNACKKLGQQMTLVIDGHNECSSEKQKRIDRCLLALCNRYDAKVVVVSQDKNAGNPALNLQLLEVPVPDFETRKQIAAQYGASEMLNLLEPLLVTAISGMEAMIIGSMSSYPIGQKSKFAILDFYVRKKLGNQSYEGVKALTAIARFLAEKFSFVLTIREMEQLLNRTGVSTTIIGTLLRAKLINQYFDRFSFAHELFLQAYTAAAIIETTDQSEEAIATAMLSPVNHASRVFLIGAIEKEEVLVGVLNHIFDYELAVSLCLGEGGSLVTTFIHDRLRELLSKMGQEVQALRFVFSDDPFRKIELDPLTLKSWSHSEYVLIHALPDLLLRGMYASEIFRITRNADEVLQKEFARLLPEAKERKIAIRSDMFAAIYCPFAKQGCTLSRVISDIHSGLVSLRSRNSYVPDIVRDQISLNDWSNGRLYLALNLSRFNDGADSIFELILHCFRDKWKYLPYHLKLVLYDSATYFRGNEYQRLKLIEAINSTLSNENPMINSFALEALSSIGAFENEQQEQEESLKFQIERILQDKENPDYWSLAVGLFNAQFDHPYAAAYSHVIQGLGPDNKKDFLVMVVRGSDDGFFTSTAILLLAQTNDPDICKHLEKRSRQPNVEKSAMPQDELFIYILVHCLMGHFNYSIDSRLGTFPTVKENAFVAIAEIYYWVNQLTLNKTTVESKCERAWEYLITKGADFATDMIYQSMIAIRHHDMGLGLKSPLRDLHEVFDDRVAAICRNAILQPQNLQVVYNWDKPSEVVGRAISMLSSFGNQFDIPLLKSMANDEHHGSTAIRSIKTLQKKTLI